MRRRGISQSNSLDRRTIWQQASLRWAAFLAVMVAKLLFAVQAHAAPGTHHAEGSIKSPRIRIANHGWGGTPLKDLQIVLDAVALELGRHFPDRELGTIAVVAAGANPMVLYEKGQEGEYVVQLSAREGRWYQFIYQFGHELCHIYSNYDNKESVGGQVVSHNQWFEESLCEAAALYTLRKLATTWESAPPAEQWADYAPTLRKYADLLLNESHRRLPASHTLPAWFRENHPAMQANPYLRQEDEVVSNQLLPLFEQNPDSWAAIGYLNAEKSDAALGFMDYLEAWCLACPERYRKVVDKIITLFTTPAPDRLQTATAAL
jgi:hypothetical protein